MNTTYFPKAKEVYEVAKNTFQTDNPTPEQIKHVVTAMIPSAYLLAHHTLRGHGITFEVPDKDTANAQSHRPLTLLGAL